MANALRLLELPEEAQQFIVRGEDIGGSCTRNPVHSHERRASEADGQACCGKLTVREAEAIARLFSGKRNDAPTKKEPLPKTFKTVAKAFERCVAYARKGEVF